MYMTLKMDMNNAAFQEGEPYDEAARILEEMAGKLRLGYGHNTLFDANGNRVGKMTVEDDDE